MSHMIDTAVDTVYTPNHEFWVKLWHNLQTPVAEKEIFADGSNIPLVFNDIVQCGMKPDFETEISTVSEDLQADLDLSQFKLILADCRKGKSKQVHPLHVPRKGYKIHQNRQCFDLMVSAAKAVLGDDFKIVTVGTLGSYTQFFMSIAIKGNSTFQVGTLANGAKDIWQKFFNLNTSHNGMVSSNRSLSTVRQVCWNTVNASIADSTQAGTIANIKHTANSDELMTPKQFESDLRVWMTQAETFQAMLAAIKGQKMTVEKFQSFASGIFTNAGSDAMSTVSFNRVQDLTALFQRGLGNDGKTVYDAVNAFTEYFTSGNGVGKGRDVSAAKRLATANFGQGMEWKRTALTVATTPELMAETCKRGEKFFADKLQVVNAGN